MAAKKKRREEESFEEELLKGLDELDESELLSDERDVQEKGKHKEELEDSSSRFYEEEINEEEDGKYGDEDVLEGEDEEIDDVTEEDEGGGEGDDDGQQLSGEKKGILSSLSHKKVILFSAGFVLFLMVTAIVLELLLPEKKGVDLVAEKTGQVSQFSQLAPQGIQPVSSDKSDKENYVNEKEKESTANVSFVGESDVIKPVVIEKGKSGKDVVPAERNERKLSEQKSLEKNAGTLKAVDVAERQEKEAQGQKEGQNVSGDIFLTFFRVGNEQLTMVKVPPEDKSNEKEKKDLKSGIPVLEGGVIPSPLSSGGINLDKFQVYAVVCDEGGQNCFAETSLGRLRKGDVISGGFETIVSISKNEIRTNVRVIGF